jgi:hypothetical protein
LKVPVSLLQGKHIEHMIPDNRFVPVISFGITLSQMRIVGLLGDESAVIQVCVPGATIALTKQRIQKPRVESIMVFKSCAALVVVT